jgi:hypothetical protein
MKRLLGLFLLALVFVGCVQQTGEEKKMQQLPSPVGNASLVNATQASGQEELMRLVDVGEPFDCDYVVNESESFNYKARFGSIRVEGKQGDLRAIAVYELLSKRRFAKTIAPVNAISVEDCAWIESNQDYAGFKNLVLNSHNGTLSCRNATFSSGIFEPSGNACSIVEWDEKMRLECGKLGNETSACITSMQQKGYYLK